MLQRPNLTKRSYCSSGLSGHWSDTTPSTPRDRALARSIPTIISHRSPINAGTVAVTHQGGRKTTSHRLTNSWQTKRGGAVSSKEFKCRTYITSVICPGFQLKNGGTNRLWPNYSLGSTLKRMVKSFLQESPGQYVQKVHSCDMQWSTQVPTSPCVRAGDLSEDVRQTFNNGESRNRVSKI